MSRVSLLREAGLLADSYAFDDAANCDKFPLRELEQIFNANFCRAPLPVKFGGAGLGTDPGSHSALLETLRELGRANLSLARIYEGHVNALILIFTYGTSEQRERAARACLAEKLFAIWNTDGARPTRLAKGGSEEWILSGQKAFASAAGRAGCFLVTADKPDGSRQMCFLDAKQIPLSIDETSWEPLGMKGSASFHATFDSAPVPVCAFVGEPGDYYRAPFFLGGAVRTSAILQGGADALLKYLRTYSKSIKRTDNALLRRRAALVYAAIENGSCWLARAAQTAERTMHLLASEAERNEMNFTANITRVAIEKSCSEVMQLVIESVGARGLNTPYRFAGIIRDLTMFLRQPDPDACITEAGRFVLEEFHD